MKRLTCEMCGSTDIVKQDGLFVCQSCGTKYSVEEARKMMIEGTVDVSGSTVKIDNSDELSNLYQIARRARDDENAENAAKYYDMILVKDPESWEAAFYVVYFKAARCRIMDIKSAANSVRNCEYSVLTLIRDQVPEENQLAAVKEIVFRSALIATLLATSAKSHYDGIDSEIKNQYVQEYVDNAGAARDIMYTCGSGVEEIFRNREEIAKLSADAWKTGIEIHTKLLSYLSDVSGNEKIIYSYGEKVGKYDPEYERNTFEEKRKGALKKDLSILKKDLQNLEKCKKEGNKIIVDRILSLFSVGVGFFFCILCLYECFEYGVFFELLIFGFLSILLLIVGAFGLYSTTSEFQKKNDVDIENKKRQISEKQAELDSLEQKWGVSSNAADELQ